MVYEANLKMAKNKNRGKNYIMYAQCIMCIVYTCIFIYFKMYKPNKVGENLCIGIGIYAFYV